MKKISKVLIVVFIVAMSTSLLADNTGCGLGTMIWKGKKGKTFELLAVTTNDYTGTPTSAITSGTSEYKAGSKIASSEVERFVDENMDMLAHDISKGNGEYLDTLGELMEVENKTEFNQLLSSNFNDIYSHSEITSKEVVSNIYSIKNS